MLHPDWHDDIIGFGAAGHTFSANDR